MDVLPLDIEAHAARIGSEGWTILEGVVDAALVDRLVERIDRLLVELETPFGTNRFLGTRTRRIFNLLPRDPLFAEVPLHPALLAVVEKVLDDGCLLSSLTAVEMGAGQAGQPFHSDDGSIPLPRPHVPITCSSILALTDFDEHNGGTRLVPRSHRFDRIPTKGEEPEGWINAVMPAGSLLVYDGSLWHGGGDNTTDARRMGIVTTFCAGWIRQEESQLLAVPRDDAAALPPRLRRLLGYSVYRGLIGHVDQVDPGTWFDPDAETDMVWRRMR